MTTHLGLIKDTGILDLLVEYFAVLVSGICQWYCCVPTRWGLQQTTLAPGMTNDKLLKIEKHAPTIGPVLLRHGETGT